MRLAANVSPTLFLSVVSVCLAAALIAVPFGKVTIVAGSAALATAAGFAVAARFAAAAGFSVSASFFVLLASSVAVFEQAAAVQTAGAAKANQKVPCTW